MIVALSSTRIFAVGFEIPIAIATTLFSAVDFALVVALARTSTVEPAILVFPLRNTSLTAEEREKLNTLSYFKTNATTVSRPLLMLSMVDREGLSSSMPSPNTAALSAPATIFTAFPRTSASLSVTVP